MDQAGLDPAAHRRALEDLRRINFLSGSARILWAPIRRLARERKLRELRVLDIASGGGDVALRLFRTARRHGLELKIVGCDVSDVAIDLAGKRAARQRASVEFISLNALTQPLPGQFDVVMCSLFLHHLTRDDATLLLGKMAAASRHLMLVNDLRRTTAGYLLAQAVCRVLSRSPIVHVDGPRSVAGAFSMAEVNEMCREAGLDDAKVARRWPQRFLLSWERPL
jgi:2-polyprenyl-3-methyl-5-hydroxy-6-metoxy-1,4-benzoquinol methylase